MRFIILTCVDRWSRPSHRHGCVGEYRMRKRCDCLWNTLGTELGRPPTNRECGRQCPVNNKARCTKHEELTVTASVAYTFVELTTNSCSTKALAVGVPRNRSETVLGRMTQLRSQVSRLQQKSGLRLRKATDKRYTHHHVPHPQLRTVIRTTRHQVLTVRTPRKVRHAV